MRYLMALVMMVGCGGGEGGDALTVDDYVPEQVRAQYGDMPEHVVTCVRFQYVVNHRVIDCSNDVEQVRFVEQQLTSYDYVAHCQQTEEDAVADAATASCLDAWATAECGALEGPGRCSLASSWGPPGD